MMNWPLYLYGLAAISTLALAGWLISLVRNNVTHVDSLWSLFLAVAAYAYALNAEAFNSRIYLMLFLVTLWAIRLSAYLTWRNWGPHEDHRYAAIRKNNAPYFWLKSLYIVFGLQAVLAWIISLPLLGAVANAPATLTLLDVLGGLLFTFGFVWQTVADWQLSIFKANPSHRGQVLHSGLWRYSRHPNYFGESCIWWGLYCIALSAGAWWSVVSPVLMTLLLLKVSGVALLEKDIAERRPDYVSYRQNTNAFFPWRPKG